VVLFFVSVGGLGWPVCVFFFFFFAGGLGVFFFFFLFFFGGFFGGMLCPIFPCTPNTSFSRFSLLLSPCCAYFF